MNNELASRITIGIATFNSGEVIRQCLKSITSSYGDSVKIIVADNNSTDDTHEIIATEFPQVNVFNSGENYGFGYSVNSIVAHSDSQYVLIMNADIEIEPNTVEPLIEALNADSTLAIVAPTTYDGNGNIEGNIRKFPSAATQFAESFLGGKIAKKLNLSETIDREDQYLKTHTVDWLKGAIWCVDRHSFKHLGGMRTDFFLYSEETEFARRAKDSGKFSAIIPNSKAIHLGGESDTNALLYTLLTLNKLHFMKVRKQKVSQILMRIFLIGGMAIRLRNQQSRFAMKSLLRSFVGFEKERTRVIGLLGGVLPPKSGL